MKSNFFKKNNLILICGPTAVGKSLLALKLAHIIDGEIINADSMQVYKYFTILTSQPSKKARNIVKHHLYAYKNINEKMTAVKWVEDAHIAISEILNNKKVPIIVGGSGMYIDFLLKGINIIPEISEKIRKKVEKDIEIYGLEELFKKLESIDPKYASIINAMDKQRITRSLEVYYQTKLPLSYYHSKEKKKLFYNFFKILILPDRYIVKENCSKRFDQMLDAGLVNEILNHNQYVKNFGIEKAIGYREILSYINKNISLEEARSLAISKTRKYAKRQSTWFRNRFTSDITIKSSTDISLVLESLRKII